MMRYLYIADDLGRRGIFRESPEAKLRGTVAFSSWATAYTAYAASIKLNFQDFGISSMRRDFRLSSFIWNGPMETLPAVVVWIVRGSRRGPMEPSTTFIRDAMSLWSFTYPAEPYSSDEQY